MIMMKKDNTYKQVGFKKVRQADGSYKDVEYQYSRDSSGDYKLTFEKGFTREIEGELPLSLNGIGKDLKDYSIEGSTEQKSYSGKNLFDKTVPTFNGYINGTENNYKLTESGTGNLQTAYISCLSNTTYTVSRLAGARFSVGYTEEEPANEVKVLGMIEDNSATSITITTGENAQYIVIFFYNASYDTDTAETILNSMQIELGSTATSYEPYVGGIPSPNPDYPQEVKGSGDRTGNLFSSKWEQGSITASGDNTTSNISIRTADYIPITPDIIYSFERSVYSNFINLRLYDKDKKFLAIGSEDTIELIAGNSASNPMKSGQSFCCFKVILADAAFIRFNDLSNDLSTEYMMVEGEYTLATMPNFEPYGYKVDVVTRGKNLFSGDFSQFTSTGGTGNTYAYFEVPEDFVLSLIAKNDYTVPDGVYIGITGNGGDATNGHKWAIQQKDTVTKGEIKTVMSSTKGMYFVSMYSSKAETLKKITDNFYIQLELGTEATSYEPYTPPITTPIYLDSPLYKIGDYADVRGNTEEVRVVKESILTGDEEWRLQSINSSGIANFYFYPNGTTPNFVSDKFVLCSHFEQQNTPIADTSSEGVFLANRYIVYIRVKQERASTVANFKAFLAEQYNNGTPVTVYYVLAEPESKAVDAVEIPTLNGTTVIDIETVVEPSNVYLKYKSSK